MPHDAVPEFVQSTAATGKPIDLSSARVGERQLSPFEAAAARFNQQAILIAELARQGVVQKSNSAVISLDAATLVDSLVRSRRGVSALVESLAWLNKVCDSGGQRSAKATLQIAPLIVRYAVELSSRADDCNRRMTVPADIELFAKVFSNNNPENIQVPGPIRRLFDLIEIQQVKGAFPKPMEILEHSPANSQVFAQISGKIEELEEQRNSLEQEGLAADRGRGRQGIDDRESKVEESFEKLMATAKARAEKATDVDLKGNFSKVYDSIAISLVLKPETARILHSFSTELSSFISLLASSETGKADADFKLSIPQLAVISAPGQAERFGLSTEHISVGDIRSEGERAGILLAVTETFLTVRDALARYEEQNSQSTARTRSQLIRSLLDDIRRDVSYVLGREADQNLRAILGKMAGKEFDGIKTHLFTAPVVTIDPRTGPMQQLAFELPKNLALYRGLTGLLLDMSKEHFQRLKQDLKDTTASGILLLCEQVRGFITCGQKVELVKFIDEQLERESRNVAGHLNQAGLLFCIEHLSNTPEIASVLKTRLIKKEAVTLIATNMDKGLSGRDTEHVIADSSKKIVLSLNVTLRDYRGSRAMITAIERIFDRNKLLFSQPERLEGIQPKLAIMNAFLLYGPPGVGKSHLVKCISNTYGLEILPISREEMERHLRRPKVTPRSGGREPSRAELLRSDEPESEEVLAKQLAEFMNARIYELQAKIKKNNASGGIIFLDEMEAEFLKRDQSGIDRDEVERTNIMLRVIEDAIEKNPEIYFFGATNYIELVDPAALRLGRFGIKFRIDRVDEESAEDLVLDSFERLQLDSESLRKVEGFERLIADCVGVVPQVLQMAIINEYTTGERNPDEDPVQLIQRFSNNLRLLKRLISTDEAATSP